MCCTSSMGRARRGAAWGFDDRLSGMIVLLRSSSSMLVRDVEQSEMDVRDEDELELADRRKMRMSIMVGIPVFGW